MAAHRKGGAVAPGLPTPGQPQKSEAPAVDAAQGFDVQGTADSPNCAESYADGKAFSTLQARAALKGCQLRALADGGYLMSQWAYSREVPDLRTVGDLLRRMGA